MSLRILKTAAADPISEQDRTSAEVSTADSSSGGKPHG
jgi:hypothetical protein